MLWVKSLQIIFMTTWVAGLFYLPRLFVYHAMSDDQISNERFQSYGTQIIHRHHDTRRHTDHHFWHSHVIRLWLGGIW